MRRRHRRRLTGPTFTPRLFLVPALLPRSAVFLPVFAAYALARKKFREQCLLPLIVAADPSDYTSTVALLSSRSDEEVGPGIVLAGTSPALVPSLIVYLSLQKSFLHGITTGAIKG